MIDIVKFITVRFPDLEEKLRKAGMFYTPEEFVKRTLMSALYMSFGLLFILFLILAKSVSPLMLLFSILGFFPVAFVILFFYFFQFPAVKIAKLGKEVNKEIVFAGRFLIVELESGVSLYEAMKNIGKSYPVVGQYFREIVEKINFGTAMEDAISEALERSPNAGLTKILWQISNSVRTGSDVAEPLKTVIETLIKEQQIQVNEYGRKLNPLAMFYMLIAIIAPSLGVTMLTIVSIFVGLRLQLFHLLLISAGIGFVQFMFITMVNSIRPPVEL